MFFFLARGCIKSATFLTIILWLKSNRFLCVWEMFATVSFFVNAIIIYIVRIPFDVSKIAAILIFKHFLLLLFHWMRTLDTKKIEIKSTLGSIRWERETEKESLRWARHDFSRGTFKSILFRIHFPVYLPICLTCSLTWCMR